MRARHLKALKSPFVDKFGEPLWDGNVIHLVTGDMLTDAFFRPLARREVVFERGEWWLYDSFGLFIDQSRRYTKLTDAGAKKTLIINDKVALR